MNRMMFPSMLLRWVGRLARSRMLSCLIVAVVATLGVAFRVLGLGRSMWLDEAWVANSVTAGSLTGMFYYDSWLQVSPPLFLVLVRIAVGSLGLTEPALRIIPLLFGLLSMVCMFVLTQRVVSARYVLPAWTVFVLSPAAISYSKTLKPYSLELAATTLVLLASVFYLQRPTERRFWLLLAIIVVGLLIAYPVAFLLPGITLVMMLLPNQVKPAGLSERGSETLKWANLVHALILVAATGAVLCGIYSLFVRPNTSPSLWTFFADMHGGRSVARVAISNGYGLLSLLPIPDRALAQEEFEIPLFSGGIVFFVCGFILACRQFRKGTRKWVEIQIICASPIVLLIIGAGFTWYPMSTRTSLFVLPALILLSLCNLQLILDFVWHRSPSKRLEPLLDIVVMCTTLLLTFIGVAKQPLAQFNLPEEDVRSAVSFLRVNVQPDDLLWVHTSTSEAFKLYTRMTTWNDVRAQFGRTEWPCCPRGIPVRQGRAPEGVEDVRRDLNGAVPAQFSGRVWLLYTQRADHWRFVGADEPKTLESVFYERGCLRRPTPAFHNIGVSSFDCKAY